MKGIMSQRRAPFGTLGNLGLFLHLVILLLNTSAYARHTYPSLTRVCEDGRTISLDITYGAPDTDVDPCVTYYPTDKHASKTDPVMKTDPHVATETIIETETTTETETTEETEPTTKTNPTTKTETAPKAKPESKTGSAGEVKPSTNKKEGNANKEKTNGTDNTVTTGKSGSTGGYRSVAYFIGWGVYGRKYFVKDLPADKLTHVMYAFANIEESGRVILSDPWADFQQKYPETDIETKGNNMFGSLKQLNLLKKKHRNLKVLLSVGGYSYSNSFTKPVSTPEGRKTFANSCVDMVMNYGFDGIDVDWEYPANDAQAEQYVQLLSETRKALDAYAKKLGAGGAAPKFDLAVSVPAGPSNYKLLKIAEMDKYLDFWNLMAYDFSVHGPADQQRGLPAGHQANLFQSKVKGATTITGDDAVAHYTKSGVAPNKIVLGLPLYGRKFENTKGLGLPYKGVGKGQWDAAGEEPSGVWDYKGLPLAGAKESVDAAAVAAYSYDPKQQHLMTYDNPATAVTKGMYIKKQGLGGAMWWEASGDGKGERALIPTMAKTLGQLDKTPNNLRYPDSRYDNLKAGFPSN